MFSRSENSTINLQKQLTKKAIVRIAVIGKYDSAIIDSFHMHVGHL